jgi:hypothetical protein
MNQCLKHTKLLSFVDTVLASFPRSTVSFYSFTLGLMSEGVVVYQKEDY